MKIDIELLKSEIKKVSSLRESLERHLDRDPRNAVLRKKYYQYSEKEAQLRNLYKQITETVKFRWR